jgi:hypothetical protein
MRLFIKMILHLSRITMASRDDKSYQTRGAVYACKTKGCGYRNDKSQIEMHILAKHHTVEEVPFYCKTCDHRLKKAEAANRHMENKHPGVELKEIMIGSGVDFNLTAEMAEKMSMEESIRLYGSRQRKVPAQGMKPEVKATKLSMKPEVKATKLSKASRKATHQTGRDSITSQGDAQHNPPPPLPPTTIDAWRELLNTNPEALQQLGLQSIGLVILPDGSKMDAVVTSKIPERTPSDDDDLNSLSPVAGPDQALGEGDCNVISVEVPKCAEARNEASDAQLPAVTTAVVTSKIPERTPSDDDDLIYMGVTHESDDDALAEDHSPVDDMAKSKENYSKVDKIVPVNDHSESSNANFEGNEALSDDESSELSEAHLRINEDLPVEDQSQV